MHLTRYDCVHFEDSGNSRGAWSVRGIFICRLVASALWLSQREIYCESRIHARMEQGECLDQVQFVQDFGSYWPLLTDPELQPKEHVQRVERFSEACLSLADSWGGTLCLLLSILSSLLMF